MKKTIEPLANPLETILIEEARGHFEAAVEGIRSGCEHALQTGMRLIALHVHTVNHGGDRRSLAAKGGGFESACKEIGIPKRTAHRWMNATARAALAVGLITDPAETAAELPPHNTPEWVEWELAMQRVAAGMTLNRLLLGTYQGGTEECRYDELLSASEAGSAIASELLEGVASGKYSLVQAVRAMGSREALEKLKSNGSGKLRRDPVYLDYDPIGKCPVGLLPKALSTLRNAFVSWDSYDDTARQAVIRDWKEVAKCAPADFLRAILPAR